MLQEIEKEIVEHRSRLQHLRSAANQLVTCSDSESERDSINMDISDFNKFAEDIFSRVEKLKHKISKCEVSN